MRVQVLLFVESTDGTAFKKKGNKLSNSARKGYALINPLWKDDPPISLLKATIPIVTPDQVNPLPSAKFELVEVWQDSIQSHRHEPTFWVDYHNLDFVKGLFPDDSKVEFSKKFKVNERNIETENRVSALLGDNLKSIEKLLTSGVEISYRHPEGATLAHFATERSSAPLIALLGKCGIDLNATQKDGCTPLHIATKKVNLKTMGALLDSGANANAKTPYGHTALHLALTPTWKQMSLPMVELLLGKGAVVDTKTNYGWTPLHMAADAGDTAVVDILLKHGANIESTVDVGSDVAGMTPLHAALKKKRWAAAKILMDNGASLDAQCNKDRNALYFAVNFSHLETVEDILKRSSKKTPGNRKAFHHSFRKDTSPEIVERLMKSGFKVYKKDVKTPDLFFGAIHKNLFELVEQLLEWGADVHQSHIFLNIKTTPMHVACRYADEKMVQLLLDQGANPEVERTRGKKPVVGAVETGKFKIVKLLLANNISIRGQTSLLAKAAKPGCLPLIELLLESGCQVQVGIQKKSKLVFSYQPDWDAASMVSKATSLNNKDMVDILMKYGARFNFQDVFFTEYHNSWQRTINPEFLESFLAHGFFELKPANEDNIRKQFSACEPTSDFHNCEYYGEWESLRRKRSGEALAQFVIKLDAAGKVGVEGVDGLIPKAYYKILDLVKLRNECEEELERMRTRVICDTGAGVTLSDILMKNLNRVSRYTRNKDICGAFDGYSFREEYPHYGSIIDCRFRKGVWRREFLNKGIKAFNRLTCRLPTLPHELKEDIIGFLTNHDIISLKMCF